MITKDVTHVEKFKEMPFEKFRYGQTFLYGYSGDPYMKISIDNSEYNAIALGTGTAVKIDPEARLTVIDGEFVYHKVVENYDAEEIADESERINYK